MILSARTRGSNGPRALPMSGFAAEGEWFMGAGGVRGPAPRRQEYLGRCVSQGLDQVVISLKIDPVTITSAGWTSEHRIKFIDMVQGYVPIRSISLVPEVIAGTGSI